jgi:hypothetical protein
MWVSALEPSFLTKNHTNSKKTPHHPSKDPTHLPLPRGTMERPLRWVSGISRVRLRTSSGPPVGLPRRSHGQPATLAVTQTTATGGLVPPEPWSTSYLGGPPNDGHRWACPTGAMVSRYRDGPCSCDPGEASAEDHRPGDTRSPVAGGDRAEV